MPLLTTHDPNEVVTTIQAPGRKYTYLINIVVETMNEQMGYITQGPRKPTTHDQSEDVSTMGKTGIKFTGITVIAIDRLI